MARDSGNNTSASKVYELYHSCGMVKFLAFILSIQHPHTLRLENTIV